VIKSFKAVKLNRRINCNPQFHEDINIITGKNGSGKTTLLKLLWYTISGNLERILPEISFDSFELVTDSLVVSMTMDTRQKRRLVRLKYKVGDIEKEIARPAEREVEYWQEL
jgi:AAA15 family ATPase/GTPase